jgi:fluoroquinolone transport system permease protein
MRRFIATLRRDLLLQYRYKLIAVSLAMVAVWGMLLAFVPEALRPEPTRLVPAFVVINLLTTTFYFICGLVLFEKGEAVLSALATTPLRDREYLVSKVVSLTLLACAETFGIVVLFFGGDVNWGLLLPGALLLGGTYTLLGFVAIARYDSINEFLMPSILLVFGLQLPLLPHFGLTGRVLALPHPVEPALSLMRAAYAPVGAGELVYAVVAGGLWLGLSYWWARREFDRFIVRAAGT